MKTTFIPKGVCSKQFDIELEDGVIKSLTVTGGCKGNLTAITKLVQGKRAEDVIPILKGTPCGFRETSCPDQISIALTEALKAESKTYSSSSEFDMDKEYMFSAYKMLNKKYDPEYGVESADDVKIRLINLDTLNYVLHAEGTHLILFGGVWSQATQNVIGKINYLARKYNVPEVYIYDFSTDGTADTTIKRNITAHKAYIGPDKEEPNAFATFNYIYGEVCVRHLSNLNDWAAKKVGTKDEITYLNVEEDVVKVPDLTEPFLFIHNKHNTVDNSGAARTEDYVNESGTYPIVYAMEINDSNCDIDSLEANIFSHIGTDAGSITPYTNADYIIDAFAVNGRGHSYKTEDAFKKGEQINVHAVNYQEFMWLLNQRGNFILYLAGPWCAFSQGGIPTVNDYAVANNLQVYMMDSRFDSKHTIDFWFYPRKREYKLGNRDLLKYYFDLWENYLPCAQALCNIDPARFWSKPIVEYVDESGKKHNAISVGIPFLFMYNKEHMNQKGQRRPIVVSKHDAGELINCSELYVYYKPFYLYYKAGVSYVFQVYCETEHLDFKEITIDRSAPIVEGKPQKHPETPFKHKEYSWYKEEEDPFAAWHKPAAAPASSGNQNPQELYNACDDDCC